MDLSFQLYSSRNAPNQTDVLKMLASAGYTQVEGYRGVYGDAAAFRGAMDAEGLTMPSGHFGVAELENDFDGSIELAQTLGIKHLVAPYIDPASRPKDTDGYKAYAARLAALHSKAADHGLTFSWHNHDFEFVALPDGSIPMKILLDEVPALTWEADLGWLARIGANSIDWLNTYGARVVAVHVKDLAPDGENLDEDGWADVGDGVLDWRGFTECARSVAPEALFIMEHDNPSDITRFATRSVAAFKTY